MLVYCTDVQLDLKTTYLHNKDPFLWKPSLFVEQERLGEGGKTREKSKANEQREAETRLKFPNVSGGFPIFGSIFTSVGYQHSPPSFFFLCQFIQQSEYISKNAYHPVC